MNSQFARQQMIEQQVRAWEVLDPRVLAALAQVPREHFTPVEFHGVAFADTSVPIGHGQNMLAPNLHGRILQALELASSDLVLEVGAGTGCLTAYFSKLAHRVVSIEVHSDLAQAAADNLRTLGVSNTLVEHRDAFSLGQSSGVNEQYDAIALTGSLPVYDSRFELALKLGGRLFAVVGIAPIMEAMLVRRVAAAQWVRNSLFETVVDPLLHAAAAPGFVF
jgi:protein-L-isoaspartate(D-aspartate) O-methyltransferase